MTRKIFWQDPYQTALDTHVTQVDGPIITVAETIFFAFSGGQERDTGTIGGQPVLDAEWTDSTLYYTLPPEHGLAPGDPVHIAIDWPRRYRLMRLHFAAEIILELVTQQLDGIAKIGAHIAADKARLDFDWPHSLTPLLPDFTAQAEALITADRAITSAFSDAARERRYWEIPGFARVPCSGTHLKTTGEIGPLKLKRKNVGKNKERISITLDPPASP